jgi:hypothetical protein
MAKKQKFQMALDPATRTLRWTAPAPSFMQSILGWLILAASTVLFLAIAGYFVFVFVLSSPKFDVSSLPGGGPSIMRDEVHQLR